MDCANNAFANRGLGENRTRPIILLFALVLLCQCTSAARHNKKLEKPIAVADLRSDIDFVQAKLTQLHPQLHRYVEKEKLDGIFDNVKKNITAPMSANEFYWKLAPAIVQVREAHLRLFPRYPKLTKKARRELRNSKGLLSKYDFAIDHGRLFVKGPLQRDLEIPVGSELIKIKNDSVAALLKSYAPLVGSDGYNTTFQKYALAELWPQLFTLKNGLLDSLQVVIRNHDSLATVTMHREKTTREVRRAEERLQRRIAKSDSGKIKSYNAETNGFNRELSFLTSDSAVAYMKIKTFSGTFSRKFYKRSFKDLREVGSQFLIIDVRDNLGGSLAEITDLYSYLAQEKFRFIKDIEVASRFSVLHADYFTEFPWALQPVAALSYPLYAVGSLLAVKKVDDTFYLKNNNFLTRNKPRKNNFNGTIYLLINGSSFSASAILAAKLKGDQRAILVGEETGGANDGTVAGRYSTETLPNSKLKLPVGLMLIRANAEPTMTGKGVLPDHPEKPTIDQIISHQDPVLYRVLTEIDNSRNKAH